MGRKQISEIAATENISASTVSKVLNHSPGVSGDVREQIYRAAERINLTSKPDRPVSIYTIIPEIPNFFWDADLKRRQNDDISVKHNIYSRLGDLDTVVRYLKEAVDVDAEVIMIVTQLNERIEGILRRLADKKLIIFLTEYNSMENTFYIGSNAERDGRELAAACLRSHGDSERVLILRDMTLSQSSTSSIRMNAFKDAVSGRLEFDTADIHIQMGVPSFSSVLARELTPLFKKCPYSSVVSFNGFTNSLCAAVQKIKLPYRVGCFGFENSPQNKKWADSGYLKAVVCQNFSEQFSVALNVAEKYVKDKIRPDRKSTFIDSRLIEYDPE